MTMTLGLTGGIASGKSTVATMLAELGAAVVDADVAARKVVTPGTPGLVQIVQHFGEGVLHADGSLNRQALGQVVFANESQRKVLEQIVHPLVFTWMAEQLRNHISAGKPVVVLDIPLLFETQKGLALVDKTAVVWVPEMIQWQRLMTRDSLSPNEAMQRIRAQMSLDQKRKLADYCIDNSGSLAMTRAQVIDLWNRLTVKQ